MAGSRAVRLGRPLGALVLAAIAVTLFAPSAPGGQSEGTPKLLCGTERRFGHQFKVRALGELVGQGMSCEEVAEIIDGECEIDFDVGWSCFSFRGRYPFIVWWPSEETFQYDYSTVIEYRRYPCSEARVNRRSFRRLGRGFPTRRQLLADDVVRCHLLRGKGKRRVRRLLGKPDSKGSDYRNYYLGLERDSYIQIDGEYLSVVWNRRGRVLSVDFVQG